jgi:pyruvate kinase
MKVISHRTSFHTLSAGRKGPDAWHRIVQSVNLQGPRPLTKFVVTLGPKNWDAGTIGAMMDAGADIFRVNFSHVNSEEGYLNAAKALLRVRYEAERRRRQALVFADLKGAEFRTRCKKKGSVGLNRGERVILSTSKGKSKRKGDVTTIYFDQPDGFNVLAELKDHGFLGEAQIPPIIYINDGKIKIRLENWPHCFDEKGNLIGRVEEGGHVTNLRGLNIPGARLPGLPVIIPQDENTLATIFDDAFLVRAASSLIDSSDINGDEAVGRWATQRMAVFGGQRYMGFDMIAPSFGRGPDDPQKYAEFLERFPRASEVGLIWKFETQQAVQGRTMRAILSHDRVHAGMLARGDLRVELLDRSVPVVMRDFVHACRGRAVPSVFATGVLASMEADQDHPSRAEEDGMYGMMEAGMDAMMFSGEVAMNMRRGAAHVVGTAAGFAFKTEPAFFRDPQRRGLQEAVLRRRARELQRVNVVANDRDALERWQRQLMYNDFARHLLGLEQLLDSGAIPLHGSVLWTQAGRSFRVYAQLVPSFPLTIVTPDLAVARRALLSRGVFPVHIKMEHWDPIKDKAFDASALRAIVDSCLEARSDFSNLLIAECLST